MPKLGMEPVRRRALIDATIAAIGDAGTLDVTMTDIASRAGVSSALAHHYFGAKDDLMLATMRHILAELASDARHALAQAKSPRERISAVLEVNFSSKQFRPEIIASWLAFYVEAQRSEALRRLLRVYSRRMHSNLMSGLVQLVPHDRAASISEAVAAMIDGLYIRHALRQSLPDGPAAIALVEDYLVLKLP